MTKPHSNWFNVTDGESFFKHFCTRDDAELTSGTTTPSPTPIIPTTEVPSYPKAIITSDDKLVSGYFFEDTPDLAVLAIISFMPDSKTQFSNTVRMFLASAQAARKTKLVVHLRGHGGGVVGLGYVSAVPYARIHQHLLTLCVISECLCPALSKNLSQSG